MLTADSVALLTESVDRNLANALPVINEFTVALLTESVDRNNWLQIGGKIITMVALLTESVDRNNHDASRCKRPPVALLTESVDRNSLMRIWAITACMVALLTESVDRNFRPAWQPILAEGSLSSRRAWIEMSYSGTNSSVLNSRSPHGERG